MTIDEGRWPHAPQRDASRLLRTVDGLNLIGTVSAGWGYGEEYRREVRRGVWRKGAPCLPEASRWCTLEPWSP